MGLANYSYAWMKIGNSDQAGSVKYKHGKSW